MVGAMVSLIFGVALIQQVWAPLHFQEDVVPDAEYLYAAKIYGAEHRFDLAQDQFTKLRTKFEQTGAAGRGAPGATRFSPYAAAVEGELQVMWALHLLDQKRTEEARAHLRAAETAYAAAFDHAAASYNLGVLYLRLSEQEKARGLFLRFLEFEPHGSRSEHVRHLIGYLERQSDSP